MNSKRAATLAELVVILAVVALMMVMVISFTVIINAWVTLGTNRYTLARDENRVKENLSSFISTYDNSGFTFYTEDENTLCVRTDEGEIYSFKYDKENNVIKYVMHDKIGEINVKNVDGVTFSARKNGTHPGQLIYCSIQYNQSKVQAEAKDAERYFTYIIAARAAGGEP